VDTVPFRVEFLEWLIPGTALEVGHAYGKWAVVGPRDEVDSSWSCESIASEVCRDLNQAHELWGPRWAVDWASYSKLGRPH
jgi:hypothetical protein